MMASPSVVDDWSGNFSFPWSATLFLAIGLLAPENWGYWRWILALVSIPGTVFDYLENNMIRSMLLLGPDDITPEIVGRASEFTLRKAQFTTAAMIIVLILLALWTSRSINSSKLSRRSRSSS